MPFAKRPQRFGSWRRSSRGKKDGPPPGQSGESYVEEQRREPGEERDEGKEYPPLSGTPPSSYEGGQERWPCYGSEGGGGYGGGPEKQTNSLPSRGESPERGWTQDEHPLPFVWGSEFGRGRQGYGYEEQSNQSRAGLGPKGYRRSRERIEEDVNEALTDSPDVDARNVEVSVQEGGIVRLRGFVSSQHEKNAAEDCLREIRGIREVRNELRITEATQGEFDPRTPGDEGIETETGTQKGGTSVRE